MPLTSDFLNAITVAADRSPGPLVVPWPMPGNLGGFETFENFTQWREFVLGFSLHGRIPQIVTAKYDRALKLHLLTWIDFDLIKAGELIALTTLELALNDCYGGKVRKRMKDKEKNKEKDEKKDELASIPFARLLSYMARHDELTDDKLPMNVRCGGSVVDLLNGKREPGLANIRNELAHGYPFDGFPWSGLLELVRDLIEYAYREQD